MPKLGSTECYRRIKKVDILPLLAVLDTVPFMETGGPSALVTKPSVPDPQEMLTLLGSLDLGGTTYRAFLRKLPSNQHIPVHRDEWKHMPEGMRRFQAPLITHPDVIMRWPEHNVEVHLEPGWLYEVAYWHPHEVRNDSPIARVHLQIDQVDASI